MFEIMEKKTYFPHILHAKICNSSPSSEMPDLLEGGPGEGLPLGRGLLPCSPPRPWMRMWPFRACRDVKF